MRRLFSVFASLALVFSMGIGMVSADTSGPCTGSTQCRTTGLSADATWFGAPIDGPVVGQVYTDTYLTASTFTSSSRGTKTTSGGVWFDQFTYVFDDSEKPMPVAESFVVGMGSDVAVNIAGKLGGATVSGTVLVVTCTYDAEFNQTCSDPVSTPVSVTWTAIGTTLQMVSSYHVKGPGLTYNEMFQGSQRQATAVASIGGAPVSGTAAWADISNSQGNTVTICHAPAC